MSRAQTIVGTVLLAVLGGVWSVAVRAEAPSEAPAAKGPAVYLVGRCRQWRVSAGSGPARRVSDDICQEIAARGLTGREACRAVGEKLGIVAREVWCTSWWRFRDGAQEYIVPDVPDDVWYPLDRERLRTLLEGRLDKDWEQPQVQRELEAVGFACGMTNRINSHVIDRNVAPRFVCIAQVGSTIAASPSTKHPLLAYGLDIWVEVQFAQQGERRPWRKIEVTSEGMGAF